MNFYKGLITNIKENEIFVFGSNPEGRHGAGAAKIALKYGAKYGIGRGLVGNTYALPTKNLTPNYVEQISPRKKIIYEKSGFKSISKDQIKNNIKELYKLARKEKEKTFFIAYQNDGKNLNGYSSEEMFDLFTQGVNIPKNIYFSNTFKDIAKEKGLIFENPYKVEEDGITHINIYTKAKTELGKLLTNLSNISIEVEYNEKILKFKSLEGWWYFLKIKDLKNKECFELCDLSGFDCKTFGQKELKELEEKQLNNTDFFIDNILKSIRYKIFNSKIKDLLKQSSLPFTHYYYYGNENNFKVIDLTPNNWILEEIEKIRKELKKENNKPILLEF